MESRESLFSWLSRGRPRDIRGVPQQAGKGNGAEGRLSETPSLPRTEEKAAALPPAETLRSIRTSVLSAEARAAEEKKTREITEREERDAKEKARVEAVLVSTLYAVDGRIRAFGRALPGALLEAARQKKDFLLSDDLITEYFSAFIGADIGPVRDNPRAWGYEKYIQRLPSYLELAEACRARGYDIRIETHIEMKTGPSLPGSGGWDYGSRRSYFGGSNDWHIAHKRLRVIF